jgi:hypothetical protein
MWSFDGGYFVSSLYCAPDATGVTHMREASEAAGTFENSIDHGIRRARPIFRDPCIYPIEIVIRGLSDDNLHARLRAKRSLTSSRVANFGFGSASRRFTSAICSSVSRMLL